MQTQPVQLSSSSLRILIRAGVLKRSMLSETLQQEHNADFTEQEEVERTADAESKP